MDTTSWKGKTVLIVEDDEVSLEFLKELFEPFSVELCYTDNGAEAVDLCKSLKPDLVLMDVQLPVMNGRQAMIEIKKTQPDLPIIAQTAFAMSGDRERYLNEGFNAYISKPINVQELLSIVKKHLG